MFEDVELRKLVQAAGVSMKAMILLGINCGFGQTDIASRGELPSASPNVATNLYRPHVAEADQLTRAQLAGIGVVSSVPAMEGSAYRDARQIATRDDLARFVTAPAGEVAADFNRTHSTETEQDAPDHGVATQY
jgi:hypothetical protein